MHAYLSTNKRSVVCDDPAQLQELASGASLVIDDCVGDARPISLPSLSERSPNSVLMSITWFGQDGPYRDFSGSDGVCQALTSQVDWLGEPGEAPLIPSGYHAQMIGGLTAFIAAMGQVLARELRNVGGASHVDVSILEASVCFTEIEALRAHTGLPTRTRIGVNRFSSTYPLGIYPCRDGWLGVTVLTPRQWEGFCRLLGLERLLDVERYRKSEARLADADTLEPMIARSVQERSAEDLARAGQKNRVPLSVVPTMEQLFDVDQYVARGAFADVTHPDIGEIRLPVTPFRLHGMPAIAGGQVARLGEHTAAEFGASGASA